MARRRSDYAFLDVESYKIAQLFHELSSTCGERLAAAQQVARRHGVSAPARARSRGESRARAALAALKAMAARKEQTVRKQRSQSSADKTRRAGSQRDTGIVLDERAQEQPADRKTAQRSGRPTKRPS